MRCLVCGLANCRVCRCHWCGQEGKHVSRSTAKRHRRDERKSGFSDSDVEPVGEQMQIDDYHQRDAGEQNALQENVSRECNDSDDGDEHVAPILLHVREEEENDEVGEAKKTPAVEFLLLLNDLDCRGKISRDNMRELMLSFGENIVPFLPSAVRSSLPRSRHALKEYARKKLENSFEDLMKEAEGDLRLSLQIKGSRPYAPHRIDFCEECGHEFSDEKNPKQRPQMRCPIEGCFAKRYLLEPRMTGRGRWSVGVPHLYVVQKSLIERMKVFLAQVPELFKNRHRTHALAEHEKLSDVYQAECWKQMGDCDGSLHLHLIYGCLPDNVEQGNMTKRLVYFATE